MFQLKNIFVMSLWWISYVLLYALEVLVLCFVIVYLYLIYAYQYWKKRGIPYLEPSFPFGNCKDVFAVKRQIGEMFCEWYELMKARGETHMGFYFMNKPFYLVVHMDMVKNVLARDFQHFHDRGVYHNEEVDPLSAHMFAIGGLKWKNLRNKLSPTFTSGKMKKMFQTLVDCSEDLKNCLNGPAARNEPVDIRLFVAQYTTDVIGSCAFGIECNSFENPNNDFARLGKKIFQIDFKERMNFFLGMMYPNFAHWLKLRITNRAVEDFYVRLVNDTITYREKNNIIRNDFMQLLIQLKNEGVIEHDESENHHDQEKIDDTKLTMNEIIAQAFLFFIAGYETSSTTMTFALYQLAKNQQIQQRVREEIFTVLKKHGGKLTYEAIMEMHYLDRVVNETLRIHPPVLILQRMCTKEYQVPGTDYVMEKGTIVMVPVQAIHHDPEIYPDPKRFDPDRFTEENKATRSDFAFLPFGEGPRICIGLRFGLMQTKVGLCRMVKNYKFQLNAKTQEPIKLDPTSIVALAEGGIWLDVERYDNAK